MSGNILTKYGQKYGTNVPPFHIRKLSDGNLPASHVISWLYKVVLPQISVGLYNHSNYRYMIYLSTLVKLELFAPI
jgi:hypothetical protein